MKCADKGAPFANMADDVSQLKLPSLAQLFESSAETTDPAHAGCYEKPGLHLCRYSAWFSDCLLGAVGGTFTA
jgi:hypothetical protein